MHDGFRLHRDLRAARQSHRGWASWACRLQSRKHGIPQWPPLPPWQNIDEGKQGLDLLGEFLLVIHRRRPQAGLGLETRGSKNSYQGGNGRDGSSGFVSGQGGSGRTAPPGELPSREAAPTTGLLKQHGGVHPSMIPNPVSVSVTATRVGLHLMVGLGISRLAPLASASVRPVRCHSERPADRSGARPGNGCPPVSTRPGCPRGVAGRRSGN